LAQALCKRVQKTRYCKRKQMARARCVVIAAVALFSVTCHAAASDAQEETCADSTENKQLMQARAKLHSQKKEAEDVAKPEEAEGKQKCPWHVSEGLGCHAGRQALCANGKESWYCNKQGFGPRLQCPCSHPLMCKDATCGDGFDNCCELDCSEHGGLRPCEGEQEEQPTEEPTTPPEDLPPTPPPLPPLKTLGKDPKGKLGLCEGDCDKDSGCKGNLQCFQRDGYTTPPGCDGIGTDFYDYCYDPKSLGLPKLKSVAVTPKETLAVCGGDCDKDEHCEKGLVCYQRDGVTTVPGCEGQGKKDWDYCVEPVTVLSDQGIDPKPQLQECTGDCDKDSGCVGALKCFQRKEFEPVPGCSGQGVEGWDYCYDPDKAA